MRSTLLFFPSVWWPSGLESKVLRVHGYLHIHLKFWGNSSRECFSNVNYPFSYALRASRMWSQISAVPSKRAERSRTNISSSLSGWGLWLSRKASVRDAILLEMHFACWIFIMSNHSKRGECFAPCMQNASLIGFHLLLGLSLKARALSQKVKTKCVFDFVLHVLMGQRRFETTSEKLVKHTKKGDSHC